MHPVYRVYLVGFAMFVDAVASFAAGVKVLGFVFVALMLVCGGITTVMLLALARRRKADLRATPRAATPRPTTRRAGGACQIPPGRWKILELITPRPGER
jgi:hypothetical protein